jgi:hypothetical protein
MIIDRTISLGLAAGLAFGLTTAVTSASAQDVIVPGSFVVAEIAPEPQPVLAPLPPQRTTAPAPRIARSTATPVRSTAPVERVAYVEPRRRVEASLWPITARPGFMWIGTVY